MDTIVINHWAVLVAASLNLVLGALWYSPVMFYSVWKRESGLSDEQISKGSPIKTYGIGFILGYIISYNLAFFLGDGSTDWVWGLTAGFLAGFGWAAAAFTLISLFEQKSWKYILVNCGFIVVYFSLAGFIIGIWR